MPTTLVSARPDLGAVRLDLATPKRPMTPARWAAIERCNAAQRICPTCRQDAGYRIPRSLGECIECAETARAGYRADDVVGRVA